MTLRARLVALGFLLGLACAAHAEIYLTTGDDGVLTFTDVPRDTYHERESTGSSTPATALLPAAALPFAALVTAAASEHGVPAALLHAVIRAESNYNPVAVSRRGAIGLMQLMPATARELGVADARDPAANISGGARYLKRLLAMFGNDIALAVAAYNAGPRAVLRSGGIPPFAETRRYVPKVMDQFRRLQSALDPAPAIAQR